MDGFRQPGSLCVWHRLIHTQPCPPIMEAGQSLESMDILQKTTGGRPVDSWQPQASDSVAERLISVNPLSLDRNRYFPERIYAARG